MTVDGRHFLTAPPRSAPAPSCPPPRRDTVGAKSTSAHSDVPEAPSRSGRQGGGTGTGAASRASVSLVVSSATTVRASDTALSASAAFRWIALFGGRVCTRGMQVRRSHVELVGDFCDEALARTNFNTPT